LNQWYVEPPAAENAAALYAQAFAALVSEDADSPSFVEKNQKALELLHQAAARTQCRFPTDFKAGQKASMPHLARIKTCAKLLAQEATLNARKGKMDLAAQSVIDGLRLARSLEAEPSVISQLVRIAAEQIATAGLEQTLNHKGFSEIELAKLKSAFEDAERGGTGMFARAFVGERCLTAHMFVAPSPDVAESLALIGQSFSPSFFDNYRKSSTNQADYAFCLDQFKNIIEAAKLPFPECLESASQWTARMSDAKSKGYVISGVMLPPLSKALERSAARLAEMRAGQVAIAVERSRLAHGAVLPMGLSSLVPQYLNAVPTDPFDGKPLRYKKKSPKAYVVYSIGPDRQDDNGTLAKANSSPGTKFDLVFMVDR